MGKVAYVPDTAMFKIAQVSFSSEPFAIRTAELRNMLSE